MSMASSSFFWYMIIIWKILLFATGIKNMKLINTTRSAEDYKEDYDQVFTTYHATSAFKCISKVNPVKLLRNIPGSIKNLVK